MSVRLALLAPVALALAACSSANAGAPSWTFAPAAQAAPAEGAASVTPAPAPTAAPSAATGMMGGGTGMMGGGTGMMGGAASAVPAPSDTPTAIAVTLTDAMRIEPASMAVPVGVPVTFTVTNTGTVLHEFTLGDAAEQEAHDREMAASGGMSMPVDEPNAIGVMPGQTKTLTYTFDTVGETLAGCHVIGHYAAGMRATITVR